MLAAGRVLDLDLDDLEPLELAGLVTFGIDRLRSRHPLLRSAVIGAASRQETARVCDALAATTADGMRAARYRAMARRHGRG